MNKKNRKNTSDDRIKKFLNKVSQISNLTDGSNK